MSYNKGKVEGKKEKKTEGETVKPGRRVKATGMQMSDPSSLPGGRPHARTPALAGRARAGVGGASERKSKWWFTEGNNHRNSYK